MPALLTKPNKVSPLSAAFVCFAAAAAAASSVTSKISGAKPAPNSLDSRSASSCLRTLPKTRNPHRLRTCTQLRPMPVDAPVTTTVFIVGLLAPAFGEKNTILQISAARPIAEESFVGLGSTADPTSFC